MTGGLTVFSSPSPCSRFSQLHANSAGVIHALSRAELLTKKLASASHKATTRPSSKGGPHVSKKGTVIGHQSISKAEALHSFKEPPSATREMEDSEDDDEQPLLQNAMGVGGTGLTTNTPSALSSHMDPRMLQAASGIAGASLIASQFSQNQEEGGDKLDANGMPRDPQSLELGEEGMEGFIAPDGPIPTDPPQLDTLGQPQPVQQPQQPIYAGDLMRAKAIGTLKYHAYSLDPASAPPLPLPHHIATTADTPTTDPLFYNPYTPPPPLVEEEEDEGYPPPPPPPTLSAETTPPCYAGGPSSDQQYLLQQHQQQTGDNLYQPRGDQHDQYMLAQYDPEQVYPDQYQMDGQQGDPLLMSHQGYNGHQVRRES
eukprot:sb/3465826/